MSERINLVESLFLLEANMSRDEAIKIFAKYGVRHADKLGLTQLSATRKRLLKKHHPDVDSGEVTAASLINSAYDTLKNPDYSDSEYHDAPDDWESVLSKTGFKTRDAEMEKNIGRKVHFKGPWDKSMGTIRHPKNVFTIVGVQKNWKGDTIYRVTADSLENDTFGMPADPEKIDLFDGSFVKRQANMKLK